MSLFKAEPYDDACLLWMKFVSSIAFVVFIPICVVGGMRHVFLQYSSKDWPKTSMTIVATKPWSDHGVAFEYEYVVDGMIYRGEDESREIAVTPNAQAEVMRRYAVGTRHDVYYKPDAPGAYSVLRPGGHATMQLVGIILASLTAVAFASGIRSHFQAIFYGRFNDTSGTKVWRH